MALGPRIITPLPATNKNRPAVSMPSVLTSIAGCLAAWECNSRADATGHLPNLPAPLDFGDNGIRTAGGSYSIATGLQPPSPYMTIGLAARAAADASGAGYFLGNLDATSGCGIRFDTAGGGVNAIQRLAAGTLPQTTYVARSLGTWFAVAISFSTAGINGLSNTGETFLVSYGSQVLNAPVIPFFLGSREGTTTGQKGTIGAVAFYDSVLDTGNKTALIARLRQVMAAKGVTIP
jgi:hypothetical protein